jgi:vacuolar-type H+-ATPase subunit H
MTMSDTQFLAAQNKFLELTRLLTSSETVDMRHSALENMITVEGRELLRRLFEEHINLRGNGGIWNSIRGSDGVERTHKRTGKRILISVFGGVAIERTGYSARGTSSLFPKDASLNLPNESYSHGIRKLIAREIAKSSFDEAIDTVKYMTGVSIPKRTAEMLTDKAAADFDSFYQQKRTPEAQQTAQSLPLIVLTTDGKGIVMRKEDLREATRKKAETTQHKLNKRRSRGEKANAKRMATVASVYSIDKFIRTPEQIIGELTSTNESPVIRPRPSAKRVWASIEKEAVKVTKDMFDEAMRRDPSKQKKWICLIDGDVKQLRKIQAEAKKQSINLIIIMDIIHVVEYLWKAARVFYEETNPKTEKWVTERLLAILQGKASYVAAGIRRSATLRKIPQNKREPIDKCAGYLIKYSLYLRYHVYLKEGFPIATGVIEGACRHLIKDRMDVTGARWSLNGAEAIIKLRSLRSSGDFEDYWEFHENQEYIRNHSSQYEDPSILQNALR